MTQNASWQEANEPDVLKRILADAYGVSNGSWRKQGTSYSTTIHRGLKISRVNGKWLVKDFSMATLGDDRGRTAKNLLFHIYNLRTNQEAIEKLAALTGVNIEKKEEKDPRQSSELVSQPLGFHYPNSNALNHPLKNYYDNIVYGSWDSSYGQVILHFLRQKTQANFETIQKSCRPIISSTKNGQVHEYNELQFAYAVYEGINARIFRPYLKSKGFDKLPLQNIGNYLFGFSNLPVKQDDCKVLFIVGGEHDCIAFNHAYNSMGWYAVTQGSETRNLKKELVALLKTRCLRLVTLFDNDNAGGQGMEKQAQEHGLQGIDLATYVNNKDHFQGCEFDVNGRNRTLNDICDVLNTEGGKEVFKKMIDRELATKKVAQIVPYRPAFSNVFHTPINEYLCDTDVSYLQLKNHLWLIQKLILQSPTGSGKTYLILHRWANDLAFFEKMGIKRIVYLCPTKSLGQQQAHKHKIPFLSSLEKVNTSEIAQSKVIAATFDQVKKLPKDWTSTSLFVVDEFHTLTSEFDYRAETMHRLLSLIKSAKYVLGITATPNLSLVKHLNYGLSIAEFEKKEKAQKINIKPILLKKGGAKDVLTDIEKRRDKGKVTVIKFDDVDLLNSYKEKLMKTHGESAVTLISSKTDAMSLNNVHYQSLMKTGRVGEEAKIVLCTKSLEAGVNFEFPAEIFYVFPLSTSSLLQMLTRPRIDRILGINLEVNAFVYMPKGRYRTNNELTALTTRFEAFTNGESPELALEILNHKSGLRSILESSKQLCGAFNILPEGKNTDDFLQVNDFRILLNNETNVYEVDELRIFHEKEVELQRLLRDDVVAFFAELKAVNLHVHIQALEIVCLEKDEEIREVLKENDEASNIQKEKIATYFGDVNTENAALTIAYFAAKNNELRQKIEKKLGQIPLPTELKSARQRLDLTTEDTSSFLSICLRYLNLIEITKRIKYKNGVQPIKTTDIQENLPQILRGYEKTLLRLERLSQRLTADRETVMTRENAPTILAGRISNAIREQIFKYRADRRIFSKTELFTIYNAAVQTAMESLRLKKSYSARNFKEVINRLEALFEVNCDKGKRYRIGTEITAKNVLDCQSNEVNDLTALTN
jgi:hypothetical protein